MRFWLKEIRGKRGYTQNEVSCLSEISRSHYTRIERGTKKPSVDTAKNIANSLRFNWVKFFINDCPKKEQNE
ncbi:helix-turn-helix domain-containing protein [Lentibacillus cibarius]|uniref:Helix-turn-helix transcriptional regulator n=1 Tax=Lentibacillus cibarius TaxID=2583219 RepID=A0A5S3QL54_9BACI|nr:helix-turn-helix transcriptional regulator [Lentibacillus cibarius]TMN22595.1 helix-turn-helix transcriptional regulator [Lentibacillus cibarius]